ncbi:DNA-binding response regulator [Lutibacter sp. HS1-25]|uniref:LytR/AlgR family response regulator transcription factor n=1 Tax=Lutibacter sp. HS1-25 TaxID=2485000 RepID=UPI001010F9B3|nr:response regulator [Lutibacter sp. HS1-25]RXP54541.1 DNA-binding response regulator [Lutibacter sp. HS1-25]
MIRYILVDDAPETLKKVKAKIDTIAKDFDLEHIASYDSSKKAFENINKEDYDLLIVDFEMPVYNGIELAKKVATNKKVIFLTSTIANEKKVINSLDISGYLSKPFEVEEFKTILKNKVIGNIITNTSFNKSELLTFAEGVTQDVGIRPYKTYYITSSRNYKGEQSKTNYVHFFGENDEVIVPNVRISINELSEKLKPYGFEKINQSTIVNFSKIHKRNNNELTLIDCEEKFTIGDREKPGIITKIRSIFGIK